MKTLNSNLNIFKLAEKIALDENTNLMSYLVIRGMPILLKKDFDEERNICEEIATSYKINKTIDLYTDHILKALLANGYEIKQCIIKCHKKAIIGASDIFGKIPFEVGLAFDYILNVPYIPGSSLKGAFRYSLLNILRRKGFNINEAEEIASIVFGSNKWSGLVGVTDAYPIESGKNGMVFLPDVITPHYSQAKTEIDIKPNPVMHLTIAPETKFKFYIYFNKMIYEKESTVLKEKSKRKYSKIGKVQNISKLKKKSIDNIVNYAIYENNDLAEILIKIKENIDIIPLVDKAILYALIRGIGAKTNVGYSRFVVIEYRYIKGEKYVR